MKSPGNEPKTPYEILTSTGNLGMVMQFYMKLKLGFAASTGSAYRGPAQNTQQFRYVKIGHKD
jgi:hypothetical protein